MTFRLKEQSKPFKWLKSIPKRTIPDNRLVHHSDRGLQYGCNDYVELLHQNHISISMTQTGDPLENAIAERVNGILKDELLEEVHSDFVAAQHNVAIAISTYNHLRPHSSIEMLTPVVAHIRTIQFGFFKTNTYL